MESGNEVELTRHGKKMAVLLSVSESARLSGGRVGFMAAYDGSCREHDMREIGVEPGWALALRDCSAGRAAEL